MTHASNLYNSGAFKRQDSVARKQLSPRVEELVKKVGAETLVAVTKEEVGERERLLSEEREQREDERRGEEEESKRKGEDELGEIHEDEEVKVQKD